MFLEKPQMKTGLEVLIFLLDPSNPPALQLLVSSECFWAQNHCFQHV